MKKFYCGMLCLFLSGATAAIAQDNVTIKGTISGDLKGYNKVYVYGNSIDRDSTLIQNGRFEFKVPFEKPMVLQFYCEYEAKLSRSLSPVAIFVDQPGVVSYDVADIGEGFHTGKSSGMKSVAELAQHNQRVLQASKAIQAGLAKKYGDTISPKSPSYNAYLTEYYALSNAKSNKLIVDFIKANPDAMASSLLLTGGMSSMSPIELEQNYKLLSKRVAASEFGMMISDFLAGTKRSEVGQIVSDFSLNDPTDKPFAFSQLQGKYVMLDFWASWCGPCKASFPHMKELYEKYKGDKFEIYSISVDQSKPDWLTELKRQNLPWLQALDTKKLAKSNFGVNGVPTVFLIDPNGKILLKAVGLDPKGDGPVEKKLTEIFGPK